MQKWKLQARVSVGDGADGEAILTAATQSGRLAIPGPADWVAGSAESVPIVVHWSDEDEAKLRATEILEQVAREAGTTIQVEFGPSERIDS